MYTPIRSLFCKFEEDILSKPMMQDITTGKLFATKGASSKPFLAKGCQNSSGDELPFQGKYQVFGFSIMLSAGINIGSLASCKRLLATKAVWSCWCYQSNTPQECQNIDQGRHTSTTSKIYQIIWHWGYAPISWKMCLVERRPISALLCSIYSKSNSY